MNPQGGFLLSSSQWPNQPAYNFLSNRLCNGIEADSHSPMKVSFARFNRLQFTAPVQNSPAALELLQDESRRTKIKSQLAKIVSSLGEPGAAERAATAILSL